MRVADLENRKQLWAVGAVERLTGEITVLGGQVYVTTVTPDRGLITSQSERDAKATLFVAAYVPAWVEFEIDRRVPPDEFERFIERVAAGAGIDTNKPFPFSVTGKLIDLEFHVINGACPMHARQHGLSLPDDVAPVRKRYDEVDATVFGIFAKDAVGNLTHPATKTHAHVVTRDGKQTVTGHIERSGLAQGAILRLPAIEEPHARGQDSTDEH